MRQPPTSLDHDGRLNDLGRLAALRSYDILNAPPDATLGSLLRLAEQICAAPIALVTLVDDTRQVFKARDGFDGPAVAPLDVGFCPIVVAQAAPLVIPDTLADPAHAENAAARDGGIRFYAGVPLLTSDHHALGTLCVLDHAPRPQGLTSRQLDMLEGLAAQVINQFETRRLLVRQDAWLCEQRAVIHERDALARVQAVIAAAGGDLDTILRQLVEGALEVVPAAEAGVLELIVGEELEYHTVMGTLVPHHGLRVPIASSLSGTCARSGKAILLADALADPRVRQELSIRLDQRATILAPVARGEQVLGVLKLQSGKVGVFTERDLQLVRLFAGVATAGLTEVRAAEAQRLVDAGAQRQRAIFDSAVDFAIIAMNRDGRITDWNVGAERILGWTAQEMRGQTADRFFTPEDRAIDRMGAEMWLARAHGRAANERWHLRKDGARFWADGEMMPLRDGGDELGFIKILRDRTVQREAERQINESELRYRTLLETVEVAFAIVEVRFDGDRAVDYRFIEVNPAFERQTGVDLRGKWVTEFAPNLERFWFDTYGHVALTGEPATFVNRAEAFGRWFDVRAQRIGDPAARRIAIFFTDTTDRHEAQLRDAVLLELGDRIGALGDPGDVALAACEVLGDRLKADVVGFGAVDPASGRIRVDNEWRAPGAEGRVGAPWLREAGPFVEALTRDRIMVVADARSDERAHVQAAASDGDNARAFVLLPIHEHGRLVSLFHVSQAGARTWSEADVSMIREVAQRTRIAVERARADRATRESEEQFRVFAQAVPNQIWVSRPDGDHYWFNDRVYGYTGLAPGTLDGVDAWRRMVHPDDRERAGAAWAEALATGAVLETQFRILRRDGAARWFLVRAIPARDGGTITRWVGTNTDIEDQKRVADELARLNAGLGRQVEERTRDRDRIWRLTADVMLVADFEGTIVAVNPTWRTLFDWSEDELVGRSFMEFVHPEEVAATLAAVGDLANGSTVPRFENRYRHRDGSYRWLSWTAVPGDGHIHAIGRDVQAEKEAAEVLGRTEAALRQAQKMEAVGQLTGGLAHDFNNLLTGITGSLDLMTTRIAQGRFKDLERYADAAQGAAKRAAALTHRLLAFSRRQTLDPKSTDVNRLVRDMEELVRRTIGPAIQFETVMAGDLWPTLVDPPQLENALLNLCINARDAMPDGGRLTIETGNRWLDARAARERELEPGQYVSLCVSDSGTGMPAEVIAKAFDPFFTTKPIGQGTGLGLSMIYGFARQSGGQVRIESEVGRGTTVRIYLPRHVGDVGELEAPRHLAVAPRARAGETVLVVDDEPTVRMLVREVLEELGYAAVEAVDGPSGLRVLQSDARVDLLVTDVGLPGGMNGRQMADAARVNRPDLKVLFITGYAENAVVGNGHLDPGMHVMTKPFAMEALASRIKELISA